MPEVVVIMQDTIGDSVVSRMRLLASGSVLLAGFLAGGVASSSAPLAVQQLRYSLRPTVTWTEWDEALGLENARFLGGSAGLGFGEYVDVTAFYVKSDDRSTHLSSLPFAADMGSPLPDQYLDVASYGTELSLVLARGAPESGRRPPIQLKYGVGFRTLVLDAFEAEVMLERAGTISIRWTWPRPSWGSGLPEDPGAGTLRRNLALRRAWAYNWAGGTPTRDRTESGRRPPIPALVVGRRADARALRRAAGLRSRLRHRGSGHRGLPRRLRSRPFRGAARLLLAGHRRPSRLGGGHPGVRRRSAAQPGRPRGVLSPPAGWRRQDGIRSRATGPGRHRAGVERLLRRQRPTTAHPERRRGIPWASTWLPWTSKM